MAENTTTKPKILSKDNISAMLSKYDTFLLDCDGVIWRTDQITPVEGIDVTVNTLRSLGKRLLFVTNNSLNDRESLLEKFKSLLKFEARLEDIFGMTYASAIYLKDILKLEGKCYLIGSSGMATELSLAGISHTGHTDCEEMSGDGNEMIDMSKDFHQDIGAVLVGYDSKFNYSKLFKAASYLSKEGCAFLATNDQDLSVQMTALCCQPQVGSILRAVSAAAKREPLVIGKPHTHLMKCITAKLPDIDLSRTIMVGDSIRADVPFAHRCGIDSLLVLTGVSSHADVAKATNGENVPTYITNSFADIGKLL